VVLGGNSSFGRRYAGHAVRQQEPVIDFMPVSIAEVGWGLLQGGTTWKIVRRRALRKPGGQVGTSRRCEHREWGIDRWPAGQGEAESNRTFCLVRGGQPS